jgi:hypothetical protein
MKAEYSYFYCMVETWPFPLAIQNSRKQGIVLKLFGNRNISQIQMLRLIVYGLPTRYSQLVYDDQIMFIFC